MMTEAVVAQLRLPLPVHTELSLRHFLEEHLRRPVTLVLTDNSATMLSTRYQNDVLCVRLHRMFLHADQPVLDEIAGYVTHRERAMPHFRRFVRDNRGTLRRKPAKQVTIRTKGAHHDLRTLYDEINGDYFAGAITASITWGTRSPRTAVRNRTVGSYSERTGMIRINPVLDRRNVPRFYVAFIVYHEMLHAALGTPLQGKRRIVHSREFRKREKLFQEYERAMAWEGSRLR